MRHGTVKHLREHLFLKKSETISTRTLELAGSASKESLYFLMLWILLVAASLAPVNSSFLTLFGSAGSSYVAQPDEEIGSRGQIFCMRSVDHEVFPGRSSSCQKVCESL